MSLRQLARFDVSLRQLARFDVSLRQLARLDVMLKISRSNACKVCKAIVASQRSTPD